MQPLSVADYADLARRRLPASVHGYVSGAAEDQATLAGNRAAFARWNFVPRLPVDVSTRRQAVQLFGASYTSPLGVAPMGAAVLCAHEGDIALAAAAQQAGLPAVLSAASTVPMERVLQAAPGTWLQAYLPADRAVIGPLLQRARGAGVQVLVVTVDVPVASTREMEVRNGFSLPLRLTPRLLAGGALRPRWLLQTFARTLLKQGVPHFENFTAQRGGPIVRTAPGDHRSGRAAMSWEHIAWMREQWPGALVVKGVLHPAAAREAARLGLDGVIVSNHGGRQLDGAVAALDALPAIVAAAPGITVMMDGGVRRGTDVLKALALGARAVFVGRPALCGLAAAGQAGVADVLELLRREIDISMALLGCADLRELGPQYLVREGAQVNPELT